MVLVAQSNTHCVAARAVLANNGVQTDIIYPQCCGMPQLEEGNLKKVAESAKSISAQLMKYDLLGIFLTDTRYINDGYDVVTLVSSCSLMFKHEWPSILPEDMNVKKLAGKTFDISEYVVDISRKEGLAKGIKAINHSITLHHACHARALNMGAKVNLCSHLVTNLVQRYASVDSWS